MSTYDTQRIRILIDPNVRVRDNQTFVSMKQVQGVVVTGASVEVYEEETGAVGAASVTEVDSTRGLVYLAVDWPSLRVPKQSILANYVSSWSDFQIMMDWYFTVPAAHPVARPEYQQTSVTQAA
jgi:hypothetical protein